MSNFSFKAKKSTGEIYKGERDAKDRFELYRLIREGGDELISFHEKASSKKLSLNMTLDFLTRVKMIDKINFARNLGLMLSAGLSLSRALSVLERQTKNKVFKKLLNDLGEEISKGETFSSALGKHPKVFSELFVSMVQAGEQSGTLSEALKSVASQMENTYNLERKVRGAMMYPAVIFGVMIMIGILMFIFVVPTLVKVFQDLNVPLPFTTRVIIGISNFIQHHGILAALLVFAIIGSFWYWFKQTSGRRFLHAFLLKMPIIGNLVQEVNAARTARTLSSLLSSGVGVVESVSITHNVVQNVYFKQVLSEAEEAIKKGDLMSKVFSKNEKLYPVFFGEMLAVGEETGKIGDMLHNVATFYESDVEQKTKDMSTVIEPILMVTIGAAVGLFAVSMISPIYSLVNVIN